MKSSSITSDVELHRFNLFFRTKFTKTFVKVINVQCSLFNIQVVDMSE